MLDRMGARKVTKDLKEMSSQIKGAFDVVKSELEDHRESINENTNEVQSLYEFMYELDAKVQKLGERIDEVQLMVAGKPSSSKTNIASLSLREKEVALVLYMENEPQAIDAIARRTGLTSDLVSGYISNLVSKGVPVVEKKLGLFTLDDNFKRVQATANVLKISEVISQGLQY